LDRAITPLFYHGPDFKQSLFSPMELRDGGMFGALWWDETPGEPFL